MAFQGFAREEQFSTNQINIDIASVINSDLREASRQSNIMADNAQMQSKWGNMYLNALINKHEIEKDNRRQNHKFFMDNRAAIQKQVEYNQKVEYENAGKLGPAPISETIIPILYDFATKAGSILIQKEVAKQEEAKKEAEAEADKQAKYFIEDVHANASPEQIKALDSSFGQKYREASAEERKKMEAHWNSLGDYKAGQDFAANYWRAQGLEKIDWQRNQFSSANVTEIHREVLSSSVFEINGREFNYSQVIESGHMPTVNEWFKRAGDETRSRMEASVRGGGGVLPEIAVKARKAMQIAEGPLRQRALTKEHQYNVQANFSSFATSLEYARDAGGAAGMVDWLENNPESPFTGYIDDNGVKQPGNYQQGRDWIKQVFESGAVDASTMRYVLQNAKIFGPNGEKLNRRTPYGASLYKILQDQEVSEHQDNVHIVQQRQAGVYEATLEVPNLSQQQARVTLQSATTPDTELYKTLQQVSQQGGHQVVKDYITALQHRSGVLPEVEYVNPHYQKATELYKDSEFKSIAQNASQYGLSAAGLPSETLPDDQSPATEWAKHFVGNIIGDLAKQNITDEASIRAAVIAATDPDNKAYKEFVRMVTPQVYEADAFAKGETIPLNKPKYYPRLQSALKRAVPYSDGRNEYETLRQNAINAGTPLNRADIWQDDILRPKMELFLDTLEAARERGPEAVQDALSRAPAFVRDIAKSWKNGSVGQVVNAAINEGNFAKKYTQLKEDEFQDPREVEALLRQQGRALMNQPEAVQLSVGNQINQQGRLKLAPHVHRSGQGVSYNMGWGEGVMMYGPTGVGLVDPDGRHSGAFDAHQDGGVRDKELGNYIVTGLQKLGYQVTEHPLAGGVTPNVHAPGEFSHDNGYKWDIPYSQFGAVGTPIGETDRQWAAKLQAAHRILAHGYRKGMSTDDIARLYTHIAGPLFGGGN